MNVEKVIEYFKQNIEHIEEYLGTYGDVYGDYDLTAEEEKALEALGDEKLVNYKAAISALEQQLQSQWIPVSERLPDDQQRVIVKCKEYPTVIGWLMHGDWHTDFGCMYNNRYDVTHWQPLPKPPEEDDTK